MKKVLVNRRIGNKSSHPGIVLFEHASKLLSPVPLTPVQPLLENGGAPQAIQLAPWALQSRNRPGR